jgi:gamma-glutamyltranspeptidase
VLSELEARGHTLNLKSPSMGDANDIVIVDGVAYGHADSREGGFALAARSRSALLPRPTATDAQR